MVGNQKLHGSLSTGAALPEQIKAAGKITATLAVCAPFPYLAQCQSLFAGSVVAQSVQDISVEARDAFMGEVAASMLSEFSCGYVIAGHSGHRSYHGEISAQVAARALRALGHGIAPIVCVGETFAQREVGRTEQVVDRQLDAMLEAPSVEQPSRIVMAYEPVRVIGTGKVASNEQAQAVHALLRARVAARDMGVAQRLATLCDGSVKPDNAGELFAITDIDGGLVGDASLKTEDFLAISRA